MKIVEYSPPMVRVLSVTWFDDLDSRAAAKVTTALIRMGMGNTSNVESVGENATDTGLQRDSNGAGQNGPHLQE